MMEFFKGVAVTLVMRLVAAYQVTSLHLLKIHATTVYVNGVGKARGAFITGLRLLFWLMMFACGFILIHVGLAMAMWIYEVPAKVIVCVMLGLGILYMVCPLLILRKVSSEEAWMKGSGAEDMLHDVLKHK